MTQERERARTLADVQSAVLGEFEVELGAATAPLVTDVRIGNGYARTAASGETTRAPAAQTRQVIHLNMDGGTYTAGGWPDDPLRRRSWLVGQHGWSSRTFARYGGDRAEVLGVARDLFSRFNVEVTDVRPTSGSFIDTVITGSPSSVLGCGCGGLAPMSNNCSLIPTAIVFIFTPGFGTARRIAEVAAQEIGHAIGLDHEMLCEDPMSYLVCGPKTFQDQFVACGEYQARRCQCSGVQNNVQELLRTLGPAASTTPGNATIEFLKPLQADVTLKGNTQVEISAKADDPQGVGKVELIWDYTNGALDCAAGGNGVDWSCTHDESTKIYTWKLDVGVGDRTYRVRVTDNASPASVTISPSRVLHLTREQPPTCDAPSSQLLPLSSRNKGGALVEVARSKDDLSASPFEAVRAGETFTVLTEVTSPEGSAEIRDVQVIWLHDGFAQSPMLRVSETLWRLDVRVAKGASPGLRQFCVRARNVEGDTATTEHESVVFVS